MSGDVWRKPCLLSNPIERSPALSNPEISVATATQRAYQREFGVRNPPKRNTILGLVNKLKQLDLWGSALSVGTWSPDHLWVEEQPPVRTPEELWDRVLDAWEEMAKNLDLFHNLVDSMPRRMRAVVDAGGLWTRY
ncbi:hypothetical protein ANN_20130 [Periplaneta americana]|uniref:DUF4817 domain-containing protein n=1 Tax=Periplaneta americana TaxID=6978 RepID=A0ABQ8SBS8_PERAM|nr:hypothetical protein ANN_20130 [Periplaneta americana]